MNGQFVKIQQLHQWQKVIYKEIDNCNFLSQAWNEWPTTPQTVVCKQPYEFYEWETSGPANCGDQWHGMLRLISLSAISLLLFEDAKERQKERQSEMEMKGMKGLCEQRLTNQSSFYYYRPKCHSVAASQLVMQMDL